MALALMITAPAWSQSQTGSLSGTVTDANEAVITSASVDARNEASGVTLHTVSSDAGLYVFPNVPPGLWTITAEKTGFKKLIRTGIEIIIAQRQTLELRLEIGDVSRAYR
jgi:hypothetical protein